MTKVKEFVAAELKGLERGLVATPESFQNLEALLEKVIQERDYYYNLWKKANAYIVKK